MSWAVVCPWWMMARDNIIMTMTILRESSQIQGSDESFNLPGSRSVRLIIPEAAAIMHRVSGFDVRDVKIVSNGVWLQVCRHAS